MRVFFRMVLLTACLDNVNPHPKLSIYGSIRPVFFKRFLVRVTQARKVRAHDLGLGTGLVDLVRIVRPVQVVVHEAEQEQTEVCSVGRVVETFPP